MRTLNRKRRPVWDAETIKWHRRRTAAALRWLRNNLRPGQSISFDDLPETMASTICGAAGRFPRWTVATDYDAETNWCIISAK